DLATIKDDLSNNILENLNIIVTKNIEQINMASNPESYEYYLKGQYRFEKRVTLEDLEIARGFFQKAVELDSTQLKALITLAKTYHFTNQYDKALDLYNKALKKSTELNNKVAQAYALNGLGTSYFYRDGDIEKALDYYEEGSAIAKGTGDKTLETYFLNNIAIIYSRKGDNDKALEMAERMLKITQDLDDKKGQIYGFTNLASIHNQKGDDDKYIDFVKRAHSISKEIGDKDKEAFNLAKIGSYHEQKKEYDESQKCYGEALDIYNKLGDKTMQSKMIRYIGNTYLDIDNHQEALEHYNRALELSIEIDDKIGTIENYTAISKYYKAVENYPEALNNLFIANKIIKKLNAPDMLIFNLFWIGNAHSERGDLDSAIVYIKRSIEAAQELGNIPWTASLFIDLATCYLQKGDTDISLDLMMKSSALAKEINNNERILWTQFITGSIHYMKQEYKTAMDEYMDPAIAALKELDEDLGLFDTSIYFLCLKELKREYDIADLKKLIEKEKDDIGYIGDYHLFKLLGERSYLQSAYDQVMKKKSNLEPEVAEKYINYPIVKEIIKKWEMNI
ncbi:uncharacterized protein METZ01_LOCUS160851, partial [marine metagenome]